MRYHLYLLLAIVLCSCSGCDHDATVTNVLALTDITPPVLIESNAISATEVNIRFNETLSEGVATCKTAALTEVSVSGAILTIKLKEPLALGTAITLDGRVKDKRGNSTRFSTPIWAKNSNPASLMITEFSTKGTENQPDRVELYVLSSGNLSGITIADGPQGLFEDRCILGDAQVWKGEYLVVQFQKGKMELPYHSENLKGLSSNNGTVVVLTTPFANATIMDAVAYSSKSSTSYEGWGTSDALEKVKALVEAGAWVDTKNSNAVDSSQSASTKTMNRKFQDDTNSGEEWYICPQGESTFGAENTINVLH